MLLLKITAVSSCKKIYPISATIFKMAVIENLQSLGAMNTQQLLAMV